MNFSILCNVTKLSEHARDEKEKFASMRETIHLLPLEKSAKCTFSRKNWRSAKVRILHNIFSHCLFIFLDKLVEEVKGWKEDVKEDIEHATNANSIETNSTNSTKVDLFKRSISESPIWSASWGKYISRVLFTH